MSLANNFVEYKEEINLILAQNNVEVELYSIIACVIRERENSANISLRDVSTRRKTDFSYMFKSGSGFPDFVVLSKNFDKHKPDKKQILGAIEAKRVSADPLVKSEQLKHHIKYFKNVIYTNGLEWQFYKSNGEVTNELPEWIIVLGKNNGEKISWEKDDEKWKKLLNKISAIEWAKT
ncbi:MAG: hypothetical protein GX905_08965 [Bacteroidales bacterium]|nr:hypothetical protein [Bacteroidales bacterium]